MSVTENCILAGTLPLLGEAFPVASSPKTYDKIIVGGGLAALFTAYEILKQAQDAGKKISVLVLADKINAPCSAGSQVIPMVEGQLSDNVSNRTEINAMMRGAINAFHETAETIDCRVAHGYEIKSADEQKLQHAVKNFTRYDIFKPGDITPNSGDQHFNLPGHDHSILINAGTGQVNMPLLLQGLIGHIQNMGGQIATGQYYEGHNRDDDGSIIVHARHGRDYITSFPPLLATGAEHQIKLEEVRNIGCDVKYTMGVVIGPLTPGDVQKISSDPMAITVVGPLICDGVQKIFDDPSEEANHALTGDFPWGGLDEERFLTFGYGDTPHKEDYEKIKANIIGMMKCLWPHLEENTGQNYFENAVVSFGAMLLPDNLMPIVGRMKDYDIAGGWAGMGITGGYAAARAYAQHVVHNNDADLKIFESMHPGKFAAPAPHPQSIAQPAIPQTQSETALTL